MVSVVAGTQEKRRILLGEIVVKAPGATTYATLNNSDKGANVTLSGGNLIASGTSSGNNIVRANQALALGSTYWEAKVLAVPTSGGHSCSGIALNTESLLNTFLGTGLLSAGWRSFDGKIYFNGVASTGVVGTLAVNDVLCHWIDRDAGTYSVRKNGGAWVTISIPAGNWYAAAAPVTNSSTQMNFGATAFAFPVPDGANQGIFSVGASTNLTLYIGSEGYNTLASELPASKAYLGRISQDVEIGREGSCWVWGNQTVSDRGRLVLINEDGALDGWKDYSFLDAPVTLFSGYEGGNRASFTTWSVSRVDTIEFGTDLNVILNLADPLAAIDIAMQPNLYPDTASNLQIVGKPFPIVIGRPLYCEGVRLDTNPSVRDYQVDDAFGTNLLTAISQVYDKGDLFLGPSDPFTPANIITTATSGAAGGGAFATGWVNDAGAVPMPFNWGRIGAFGGATDRFLEGVATGCLRMQSQGLLGRTPQIFHKTTSLSPGNRYRIAFSCTALTTAGQVEFALSQTPNIWKSATVTVNAVTGYTVDIDPVEQAQLRIVLGNSTLDATIDNLTVTTVQIIDWTNYNVSGVLAGFTLANVPEGKVVCNPIGALSGGLVTETIQRIFSTVNDRLNAILGYTLSGTSVSAFASAAPNYRLAAYITQPKTFLSFIRDTMDCWCGWGVASRNGDFAVGRVTAPSNTSTLTLNDTNILGEIALVTDEAKNLTTRLAGARNNSPHSDGDIATSVTDAMKVILKATMTIVRSGIASPSGVVASAAYRTAISAPAKELMLQDAADIQAEANRIATLWRPTRTFYMLTAILNATDSDQLEPGQTVTLVWPRYGLSGGKNLLVVGVRSRFFSKRVDLKLWG